MKRFSDVLVFQVALKPRILSGDMQQGARGTSRAQAAAVALTVLCTRNFVGAP